MRDWLRFAPVVALAWGVVGTASAAPNEAAVAKRKAAFVEQMVAQHGFDRARLQAALADVHINSEILHKISNPVERVVPWYDYRQIFLTRRRIALGAKFWDEHARELAAVSRQYGVAPEVLVAVLGIESYYGERMGHYRVLDALATLAFAYPPRADFFRTELESLFLIQRMDGPSVLDGLGSYAGAMGAGQFMPSSYKAYAVDGDGDGHRDLWHDWDDILASVANYLARNGWQRGMPVAGPATRSGRPVSVPMASADMDLDQTVGKLRESGYDFRTDAAASVPAAVVAFENGKDSTEYWVVYQNFRVIMRYNHSPKYALAAHELGEAIRTRHLEASTQ